MARQVDDPDEVNRAIDRAEHAYRAAMDAVRRLPDSQQAFEAATALRDAMDRLVGEAANLRAEMARRIWAAEELSLAQLADRIGVSKARAAQFMQVAGDNGRRRKD